MNDATAAIATVAGALAVCLAFVSCWNLFRSLI